jgi:ATP-dependent helicase/nuclease subunit A
MTVELVDGLARRRIRGDLGATLVVEAAAGTGKTTELVARIVAVLRAGASLARMVAVTFTEKAAGEMKLRVRTELERARLAATDPGERRHLDGALAELEAARIGTIHSLCSDLLRERPVEARVDPLFEVAADDERRLFELAFDGWFQQVLAGPPEGVRRILRRRPRGLGASGPRHLLREAGWKLVEHRDFEAPWRRDPFDRLGRLGQVIDALTVAGDLAPRAHQPSSSLGVSMNKIHRFIDELRRREAVQGRDPDGLEAELRGVRSWKEWKWKGSGNLYGPDLTRADVLTARQAALDAVRLFLDDADADLAACLHDELQPLVAEYERLKARAGKLDFLDLLIRTRDLVRDDPAVRAELQARFSHIFVDEFQDTDPLQAEILLLLAADDPTQRDFRQVRPVPGKLFLVGDPKQSIYRFRRADVALYEATKQQLVTAGAEVVYLTTSFRGAPSIQQAVNAAFALRMLPTAAGTQATYVPLQPHRPDPTGRPTVIALPVPEPYSQWGPRSRVTGEAIDLSLPSAVGAFIDWMLKDSGWTVTERDDPTRQIPVDARHVCLLFKRFQSFGKDVTKPYVRALEARRIPHVLVGGHSFHEREEVTAMVNALTAIEWPDDELAVFATLRGPFFALGDDALLAYRHILGGESMAPLHPFHVPDVLPELAPEDAPILQVAESLRLLAGLHEQRNRRPIADTLGQLLDKTRAHAGVAIWPTGEQSLANILRVLDLARRFDAAGATSFRAFVERMNDEAERGDAAEAPVVEEGTEGVRIMTVHRAKGLEFPVVILCDPTAPASPQNPSRHVEPERHLWVEPLAGCAPVELLENREDVLRRDAEESIRVAYVAATRARDLLVVPVVGDASEVSGWLDVLAPAVYPKERRRPTPAAGCPPFGDDSVKTRPIEAMRDATFAVAPGEHVPREGDHRVVWWDPNILRLHRQDDVGLRQQKILEADAGELSASAGTQAHAAWQERRRGILQAGVRPAFVVRSATEVAEAGRIPELEEVSRTVIVQADSIAARRARPRGKRFGILVHTTLAAVDLRATPPEVLATARAQARMLNGPTEDEIYGAQAAVCAALAHPLLARARRVPPSEIRREAPIQIPLPDGSLVEGLIDLAFPVEDGDGGGGWMIVDFKTVIDVGTHAGRYQSQIDLYVRAVEEATGKPASGTVLIV